MTYLERFNKRMSCVGDSIKDEHKRNDINLIQLTFKDDISYTDGLYFWSVGKLDKDDYKQDISFGARLYSRKFSAANGTTMKFQSLNSVPIVIGDIVYDSNQNEYWICTESFWEDEIVYKGELTKCNWILKWQDKNGFILQYPCYSFNSTQYNSGETQGKILTFGSAQHQVTLPCDDNTLAIRTPQRFYLDKSLENPVSYVVTQNDNTTYNYGNKGIVKITFLQSVEDAANDRPDLGICDYRDPTIDPVVEDNTTNEMMAYIQYKTKTIKSGGNKQKFTAIIHSENVELNGIQWNIVCDYVDALIVDKSGNDIFIGINNDDYLDSVFRLELQDSVGNILDSVVIQVVSLL